MEADTINALEISPPTKSEGEELNERAKVFGQELRDLVAKHSISISASFLVEGSHGYVVGEATLVESLRPHAIHALLTHAIQGAAKESQKVLEAVLEKFAENQ